MRRGRVRPVAPRNGWLSVRKPGPRSAMGREASAALQADPRVGCQLKALRQPPRINVLRRAFYAFGEVAPAAQPDYSSERFRPSPSARGSRAFDKSSMSVRTRLVASWSISSGGTSMPCTSMFRSRRN